MFDFYRLGSIKVLQHGSLRERRQVGAYGVVPREECMHHGAIMQGGTYIYSTARYCHPVHAQPSRQCIISTTLPPLYT